MVLIVTLIGGVFQDNMIFMDKDLKRLSKSIGFIEMLVQKSAGVIQEESKDFLVTVCPEDILFSLLLFC